MSVTSISSKNKNLLWAVSAGRCEYIGCSCEGFAVGNSFLYPYRDLPVRC